LAWAYKRVKAISKRVGKGFLELLSGKGRVHFSAKKCCVNVRKAMPGGKAEKELIM
jgi:hypothetical protein